MCGGERMLMISVQVDMPALKADVVLQAVDCNRTVSSIPRRVCNRRS